MPFSISLYSSLAFDTCAHRNPPTTIKTKSTKSSIENFQKSKSKSPAISSTVVQRTSKRKRRLSSGREDVAAAAASVAGSAAASAAA